MSQSWLCSGGVEGVGAGDATGGTGIITVSITTVMDSIITTVMDSIITTVMDSVIIIVGGTGRPFSSTTIGHIAEWHMLLSAGRVAGSDCGPFSSADTL